MNFTDKKIVKKSRRYFSENLDVTKWKNVEIEMKKLDEEEITSTYELINFMEKIGELTDILSEEMAWRYINMTRFADNEEYSNKFNELSPF